MATVRMSQQCIQFVVRVEGTAVCLYAPFRKTAAGQDRYIFRKRRQGMERLSGEHLKMSQMWAQYETSDGAIQEIFVLRRKVVAVCLPFPVDKPHGHFAVPGRCPPSVPIFQQAEDPGRLGGYVKSTAKVIHVSKEWASSFSGSSTLSLDPADRGTTELWNSSSCLPVCTA
jgi:hypothetical protein